MSQWHGITSKILPGFLSEFFPKLQDDGMKTPAMGARVSQVDFNVTSGYSPRVLAGSFPRYVPPGSFAAGPGVYFHVERKHNQGHLSSGEQCN